MTMAIFYSMNVVNLLEQFTELSRAEEGTSGMQSRNKMEEREEEVQTISFLDHQGKCEITGG